MSTAIKTLMAKARYDGLRREVFLRSAAVDGKVYVELLADDQCSRAIVEIDPDGYRVLEQTRRFISGARQACCITPALPAPTNIAKPRRGIEKLRELLAGCATLIVTSSS